MISTHILDTCTGTPAANIPVVLQIQTKKEWKKLKSGVSNSDGRFSFDVALKAGTYQIIFDVEGYLSKNNKNFFYTQVPVIFKIKDTKRKYHVPLLLNPFGYSTYRGS